MTNRLALYIAAGIFVLLALDLFLADGLNLIFLGKELVKLIDWIAFWR
ncbi:MAG: hypothetical protein ABJL72_12320 [Roseobacter sp.]